MPRKKAATAAAAPRRASKAATEAKPYRHTRTGAIRLSTSPLGFPYVAADEAAPEAASADPEGEA